MDGAEFADGAGRLAGLAGLMFGWRPHEFWTATPAELATLVAASRGPGGEPLDAAALGALKRKFPDEGAGDG